VTGAQRTALVTVALQRPMLPARVVNGGIAAADAPRPRRKASDPGDLFSV